MTYRSFLFAILATAFTFFSNSVKADPTVFDTNPTHLACALAKQRLGWLASDPSEFTLDQLLNEKIEFIASTELQRLIQSNVTREKTDFDPTAEHPLLKEPAYMLLTVKNNEPVSKKAEICSQSLFILGSDEPVCEMFSNERSSFLLRSGRRHAKRLRHKDLTFVERPYRKEDAYVIPALIYQCRLSDLQEFEVIKSKFEEFKKPLIFRYGDDWSQAK